MHFVRVVNKSTMRRIIRKRDSVGLFLALDEGPVGPVLVACNNSTGAAWVEEFDSISGAYAWLHRKEEVSNA